MSEDIINPNEEAARDPRVDTQRETHPPDSLAPARKGSPPDSPGDARRSEQPPFSETDRTLPVDSDEVFTQEESGALDRPPNEGSAENPTGDAHFYELSPTSTSGATATQEAEEDSEEGRGKSEEGRIKR